MMRVLKILLLALLAISVAGLGYDAVSMPRHTGPETERFNGSTFYSPSYANKRPGDILRWSANRNQGPWEPRATRPAADLTERETDAMRVTMVNHSTLLIQVHGINLLTDPIWSESTGPYGKIGPSRYRQPGIPFNELPPIDVVFVSHSHYDHMDLPTLKRLNETHQPLFVAGLGNAGNLAKVGIDNVAELDWWQDAVLNDSLTLTLTPAAHWSKRSILDTNRTLWGSFVLRDNSRALLFFAGDTGSGEHFQQVYDRFGAVHTALMPIGAYLPRWFMKDNHISPAEALEAARTLGSDVMIPIHFGTFALGDDGQDEPLVDLLAAYQKPETRSLPDGADRPTGDTVQKLGLRVLDNGQSTRLTW